MIVVRRTALIAVVLAVMVGPAVLIALNARQGSARFAADERVGTNELTAGRIDIQVGTRTVPVVGPNLAPGDRRSGSLEFVNAGTADLRFSVSSLPSAGVDHGALGEWITWRFWWSADAATCTDPGDAAIEVSGRAVGAGASISGDVTEGHQAGDRVLAPGQADVLCATVDFDIDAPNSLQSTSLIQSFEAAAEQVRVGAASGTEDR